MGGKATIEGTIAKIEALFNGEDQDPELPTAMDSMNDPNLHLTAHGRKLARKYLKELLDSWKKKNVQ
jgi:hypothetical protein